jgi:hypothetical protein
MILVTPILLAFLNNHNGVSVVFLPAHDPCCAESYSEAATLELRDRGKHTIIPPPPKKSAMDKARNREARYLTSFVPIIGSLEYI